MASPAPAQGALGLHSIQQHPELVPPLGWDFGSFPLLASKPLSCNRAALDEPPEQLLDVGDGAIQTWGEVVGLHSILGMGWGWRRGNKPGLTAQMKTMALAMGCALWGQACWLHPMGGA